MPALSKCRWCGKLIRWATTERANPIPLDPDPAPGNIVVTAGGIAHVLRAGEIATSPTYVCHKATCGSRSRAAPPGDDRVGLNTQAAIAVVGTAAEEVERQASLDFSKGAT